MKRQYNPHANIQPLTPVRLVEPRYPDGATRCKAREKLEAVLGLKIWVGDKDAIEAGRLLREVLGVSWQPKTLHNYRKRYWQQGVHWFQAPGPKGLVTFDLLEIVAWWYQQQEKL